MKKMNKLMVEHIQWIAAGFIAAAGFALAAAFPLVWMNFQVTDEAVLRVNEGFAPGFSFACWCAASLYFGWALYALCRIKSTVKIMGGWYEARW